MFRALLTIINIKSKFPWLGLLLLLSFSQAKASPWVEADDAYLRSDIQLLVDAGVLTTPAQTFPLPWHAIARDLKDAELEHQSLDVQKAYAHVRYALETAQLGRGNKQLKLAAANTASPSSFGQYNPSEWLVTASYSGTFKRTAGRLTVNYGQFHGESDEISLDGSFLAYTTGNVDLTLGSLHKWWGPTWQSTLAQPFQSRSAPTAYATYSGNQLAELNGVQLEGGISYINDSSPYETLLAGRINVAVIDPLSLAASYLRYQDKTDNKEQQWLWYDLLNQLDSNNQFLFEARVSLPEYLGWHSAVYSQHLLSDSLGQEGANITGIESHTRFLYAQLRLVVENKYNPLASEQVISDYLSSTKINNGQIFQLASIAKQLSLGAYVQLDNNQQFSLFYHHEQLQSANQRWATEYQAPLFSGLINLSLSYSDADWQSDKVQLATSWDYRF